MTGIAVLIPTLGDRISLAVTLESVMTQTADEDIVAVWFDDNAYYDQVQGLVHAARQDAKGRWRALMNWGDPLGACGHAGRNELLKMLDGLGWTGLVASIDDDDVFLPGALQAMRDAAAEHPGRWFCFTMRGGPGSHWKGMTVPVMGPHVAPGNVGTPMIVWPAGPERYGVSPNESIGAPGAPPGQFGYWGDWELCRELLTRRGEPVWRDFVVAEIRPAVAERATA